MNGATLPLGLWALYMDRATEGTPPLDFPEADYGEFRVCYDGYAGSPPATHFTVDAGGS